MTPEQFWDRVDASGDCWLWTGRTDRDGYGMVTKPGRIRSRAHRFAYEDLVGPIPKPLVIDHLCRVRHCVNPDHLEPVTTQENTRRGFLTGRPIATHCKWGHRMDGENVLSHRSGTQLKRQCRICWAGYFRKYRAQKKAAAAA